MDGGLMKNSGAPFKGENIFKFVLSDIGTN